MVRRYCRGSPGYVFREFEQVGLSIYNLLGKGIVIAIKVPWQPLAAGQAPQQGAQSVGLGVDQQPGAGAQLPRVQGNAHCTASARNSAGGTWPAASRSSARASAVGQA